MYRFPLTALAAARAYRRLPHRLIRGSGGSDTRGRTTTARRGWCIALCTATVLWGFSFVPESIPRHPATEPTTLSLTESIGVIRTVPVRARQPGYSRARFGSGWQPRPQLGTGCTVRHESLLRGSADRTGIPRTAAKPLSLMDCASHPARGVPETVLDPYTNREVPVSEVEIDHIFPLSAAWDMGAAEWDMRTAIQFANDPLNLVAVEASANQDKSDHLPSSWMPPYRGHRCWYSERLAAIAVAYDLALTPADIARMKRSCVLSPAR